MLTDKRLVLTGVVTPDSIAYAVAERAQQHGAELLLTSFPRDRPLAEEVAARLPRAVEIVDVDMTSEEDLLGLEEHVRRSWGAVDGALHAVAFAPREALSGDFLAARAPGVNLAFQTSAFSYAALGRVLRDLAPPEGGSLVGLDFDAAGAWPVYNWMGVVKAALESANRYLARDLGERGVRVNLVAAGPIKTMAAKSIPGFDTLADVWTTRAPMGWDLEDPTPAARACVALLSDWFPATTGEVVHVDGGVHAIGA